MEVKRLNDSHREAFTRLMRYAFGSTENSYADLIKEDYPESQPWLLDISKEVYGIWDQEQLVSTGAFHQFKLRLRNKMFPMGGIYAIATSPYCRNRGYIRKILHKLLEDMNAINIPISVLYPFKYSFYEQYDWRLADQVYFCRIDIDHIIDRPVKNRIIREVGIKKGKFPEDIKTVYRHCYEKFNFIVDRTDKNWRATVDLKTPGFWFVCYDEKDSPCGYLGLRFLKRDEWWWLRLDEQERSVYLRDIFWRDRETKQALFNFLKTHRDHRKYILFSTPCPPFISSITTCNYLDIIRHNPNAMVRIVNVKNLFEAFEYSTDVHFVLKIIDNFCSWNNKSFRFKVTNNKAKLDETNDAPDVTISIGSLSQMAVGFRNASQLWESWEIECKKEMIPILDNQFPLQTNFLRDFF
ncbi:MAG: enhanced intracellular survival protein Eis [Candidatus Hodarchaeota archaeon]